MNKAELVKIIYETVKSAVKSEMKTLKAEIISEIKKSKTTVIKESPKDDIDSIVETVLNRERSKTTAVKSRPKEKIQLSSNPLLNDILNETYISSNQHVEDEWPTIKTTTNAKTFDRASMAAALGYGDMGTPTVDSMIPKTTTEGGHMRVNAEELPDHVTNALTRDYSELVKRFKK